jgi:hypothetical protein
MLIKITNLSIYLPTYLPTYLSIYLPIYPSSYLTYLPIYLYIYLSIYLWLYSPSVGLCLFFRFLILYTVDMAPWMRGQPVARSLLTHRTTLKQNKRTDIYALSGFRAHDPSVRESENSSCVSATVNSN